LCAPVATQAIFADAVHARRSRTIHVPFATVPMNIKCLVDPISGAKMMSDTKNSDSIIETCRLWFEWDEKGSVHMDSIDPRTGRQVPLYKVLNAWTLMTMLIKKSYEMQIDDETIPERAHEWAKSIAKKMQYALEIVTPERSADEPTNVGIRKV